MPLNSTAELPDEGPIPGRRFSIDRLKKNSRYIKIYQVIVNQEIKKYPLVLKLDNGECKSSPLNLHRIHNI
jgi:hypothetical protein